MPSPAARAPPRADGGARPRRDGVRQDARRPSRRAAARAARAVGLALADEGVAPPETPRARGTARSAPPSCSSTLWQSRTRRVAGESRADAPQDRAHRQAPRTPSTRAPGGPPRRARRSPRPSASRRAARGSRGSARRPTPAAADRGRSGAGRASAGTAARTSASDTSTRSDSSRASSAVSRAMPAAIRRRRPQDRDAPDRGARLRDRQRPSCPAAGRRRCPGGCRRSARAPVCVSTTVMRTKTLVSPPAKTQNFCEIAQASSTFTTISTLSELKNQK